MAHLQQIAAALLTLAFGALALAAWLRAGSGGAERPAVGWCITGTYFVVAGVVAAVHALGAAAAGAAGSDSVLWRLVSEWGLAANVARSGLALAFPLVLGIGIVSRRAAVRRPLAGLVVVFLAAAAVAGLAARELGDGTIHQHVSTLAVLGTLTALGLMAVLLVALANDGLDQLLWFALTMYTLKEVVSVSLLSIIAWWAQASSPNAFRLFYWLSIAVMFGMCALAAWRLSLARSGKTVPALLQRIHPVRPPAIG